jgi:lipopolysaccharide transport system permease protein
MRIPGRHFLRNLVERRALTAQLVRRDFEARYKGSVAGWLWGVLNPLVMLASWYFVFVACLHQTLPPGGLTQSYIIFLFCGYLPWMLFQETVSRSAGSLVDHSNLITRTVFPAEVVPVSIFLSSLLHHLIGVGMVVVIVAWIMKTVSPMILLLPLYMLFVGLLAVGVGWMASSLHVYLRDTGQVLNVVLQFWFWLTPVMISEESIPARFHPLIAWNPLALIVRAYRERLLSAQWPRWQEVATLAVYSGTVFVLGGLFFRHLKRGFADVL